MERRSCLRSLFPDPVFLVYAHLPRWPYTRLLVISKRVDCAFSDITGSDFYMTNGLFPSSAAGAAWWPGRFFGLSAEDGA